MQFLGVGPAELIVILVVALIFVGPERLPRLAADLARLIRELRQYTGSLAAEFNEVVQDIQKETEGERSQWKEIGEGLTGATRSVTDALRAARTDAESAGGQTPTQTSAPAASRAPANNGAAAPADAAGSVPRWVEIAEPETQTNGSSKDGADPVSALRAPTSEAS